MSSGDDCIRFEHFVNLLHGISTVHPRHKCAPQNPMTREAPKSLDLVNQWVSNLRRRYNIIPPHTCKIFFRFLFPEEDVRRRYNLKETTLARTLAINVFGLAINPQGASSGPCRLMQWAEYSDAHDIAKQGCLGIEVEKTVAGRYAPRQAKSPSIQAIDSLLDELASLSAYSNLGRLRSQPRRSRASILRDLYLELDPLEAKFITQIILKDLRPVLYPLSETHTTKALLHYNGNALHVLSKWEVMRAWHSCMPKIYRVRATLDEASRAVEDILSAGRSAPDHQLFLPVLGIPIEIPKSQKGVNLSHALRFFQDEDEVWAETKYDGERMQIHVDLSRSPSRQITIFSKSKRDSTQDRMGTHPIIRASLGLPPCTDDYLHYPTLGERAKRIDTPPLNSVILDAEMVCYSESKGDIDEFWRIRSLVESTARGVRGSRYHSDRLFHVQDPQSQDSTECKSEVSPEENTESLRSNASDIGDRHLNIVFFDLMFLNGCSLLNRSYCERRGQLEQIINVIPGYSSLSWRQGIKSSWGASAVKHLAYIFSQHIANYQEGLVLKGSTSTYNDLEHPWVKLKRDYIPGYGDAVDLVVIGASWNKVRARELRVAPETLTTFFVAALDTLHKVESGRDLFQLLFTVEYGMGREELETLNFYIKSSEPQLFGEEMWALPYRFRLPPGLSKPTIMFSRPLLGELIGAGFTKDLGATHYSLRFPRLTKVWRATERNWTEGSCLEEFQKIARSSIGRESSDEWATRNVDAMWGNDNNLGPKDTHKVTETMRLWYEKFLRLEGLEDSGGISKFYCDQDYSHSKRKTHPEDSQRPQKRRKEQRTRRPAQPLGSMTNVSHKSIVNWTQGQGNVHAAAPSALMPRRGLLNDEPNLPRGIVDTMGNNIATTNYAPTIPNQTMQTQIITSFASNMPDSLDMPIQDLQARMLANLDSGDGSGHPLPSPSLQLVMKATSPKPSLKARVPETNNNTSPALISESFWPQNYVNTAVVQFIQDAYVWIHKDSNNRRPVDRPPASHLVPQHRRIGVIYFLLIICGCRVEVGGTVYFRQSEQFSHVNKCVMFVKTGDQPEVREGLDWLFCALESWRAELNKPGNKELFVFDSEMINHTSLSTFCGDVAAKALWRSSRN